MNLNNNILFYLIGKDGIAYPSNFIPAEQGWLELPNYIDDLVSAARCGAASMIEAWIDDEDFLEHMNYVKEHEIKLEDLTLYLNVALIVANKDIFIIYISDFLDHLVWPVHFDNSNEKISEWETSCGDWPAAKDDIFKWCILEP